jgi:2-dehydro-3-deoxyphosphogluconate aldolase / (4S)-4-hydroxy-2-oxoglutarate aldolase
MARFTRMQVLNTIYSIGMVPIFYLPDLETSIQIVSACSAGGAKAVEMTNRGDNAWELFASMVKHFAKEDPSVILGGGTILDPATAALYINCGANFIVAPNFNPEVAEVCNRRKVAYMPGCGSASEISDAEAMGSELIKVFPANSVGGADFFTAMLGPCPWSSLIPTGSAVEYSQENVNYWFKAGAVGLGAGGAVINNALVSKGDFAEINARCRHMIEWVKQARAAYSR